MYKQILVPVDLNDKGFSDKAVEIAVWHAKHSNAEVHLLNVLPGIHMSMVASYFPKDAAAQMKNDVKAQLKAFADQHISDDVVYKVHVTEGKPYATILDYAERLVPILSSCQAINARRLIRLFLALWQAKWYKTRQLMC